MKTAQQLLIPLMSEQATDPELVGPKAANLARLGRAGLPIPGGFCLSAEAYRAQMAELGLGAAAQRVGSAAPFEARRIAVELRLELYQRPIAPSILEPLVGAWRALIGEGLGVVRSSALVEDRAGATFAGQFESFLGLDNEADLVTSVRACWAALWSTNARRYMANRGLDPGGTRSEEHTSELQSHVNLVCRLLLEKKKQIRLRITTTKKEKKKHE